MKLIELFRLIMANKDLILEIIEFIRSLTGGGEPVFAASQFPKINALCEEEGCDLEDLKAVVNEYDSSEK